MIDIKISIDTSIAWEKYANKKYVVFELQVGSENIV